MHIGFNMFVLYMFGPVVEDFLGEELSSPFYLLCGIAGGMMYLLLWKLDLLTRHEYTPRRRICRDLSGVLIAARLAPREEVLVLGLIPGETAHCR